MAESIARVEPVSWAEALHGCYLDLLLNSYIIFLYEVIKNGDGKKKVMLYYRICLLDKGDLN